MNANIARTIRRHLAAAGNGADAIRTGIAYARAEGATSAREGYILAVSRILYTDEDLANGTRFSVEAGHGPR